ncbi:MAG: hypothetical protein KBS74_04055 [Clostridiales bacterium]|nr:hypothetical protein [Candidatus Cacconaster stercorequi]
MKRFNGYNPAIHNEYEALPAGGYICRVENAEVVRYGDSEQLKLSIDIADGEYKDFYAKKYRNDDRPLKKWSGVFGLWLPKDDGSKMDRWAVNRFNNFIGCIEDANPGYCFDWDEGKLKGKTVALVFREEEFMKDDGSIGAFVKPFKAISVGDCRDGKWGKYDRFTPKKLRDVASYSSSGGFGEISEDDETLPF